MKNVNVIGMIFFILAIVLGTSCKNKKDSEEVVVQEPEKVEKPAPPPTEEEFLQSAIPNLSKDLNEGELTTVSLPSGVIPGQNSLKVSKFPLEFKSPEEKPYVEKYLFPSVVVLFESGTRMDYWDLPEYLLCWEKGDKVQILKESGVPGLVYEHVPTTLVQGSKDYFKVLDQNGEEMPLRAEWPQSLK